MWTIVKIIAVVSATLLVLLFIGLLIMVSRPAVLVGVSGDDLAISLSEGDGLSDGGRCQKSEGGKWSCTVHGPGATGSYEVDVNWMGCWSATPRRQRPGSEEELRGCIRLGDVITLGSLGD